MLDQSTIDKTKTVPKLPGCYIFYNSNSKVLYVGKAKNLKKRVSSYFQNYKKLALRLQIMVENISEIKFHVVDNEIEALMLEANLIKKYKPKYNIMQKNESSSYSWIKITKEEYPRVYRTRNRDDKKANYYGPFMSAYVRDQVYNFIRRNFPFRSCSYKITVDDLRRRTEEREKGKHIKNRLCTYYHIGRCDGPCEDLITHEDYSRNIDSIKKFLTQKRQNLSIELENSMRNFADNLEYEKAAKIKKQLEAIQYMPNKMKIKDGYDEDDVLKLEHQRAQKGLEYIVSKLNLIEDFNKLDKHSKVEAINGFRIECFDISNIQGTNAVGSMVTFENAIVKKSDYRKFKIKSKETPDDFAMMHEMLKRRLLYLAPDSPINKKVKQELKDQIKLDPSFLAKPNLIIIDGGKGQLKQGEKVLKELGLENSDIKICSLAKKREKIFMPGVKNSFLFDNKPESLFLLQRIRDEAHRFGITFHRKRRGDSMFT